MAWCLTQRLFLAGEVGALDAHEQGVDRFEEQHVYVARTFVWRSRSARGMCSVKHPEKGEVTSVEEAHDVQVTTSSYGAAREGD